MAAIPSIPAVPIDVPAYRDICLVMRDRARLPVAARRFLDYLKYREGPALRPAPGA